MSESLFTLAKIHTDGVMCSWNHLQNVILSLQGNKITLFSEEKKTQIIRCHPKEKRKALDNNMRK
jgi:hypothetical protein